MSNKQQAIKWTNADTIHWSIFVALGGDVLTHSFLDRYYSDHADDNVRIILLNKIIETLSLYMVLMMMSHHLYR